MDLHGFEIKVEVVALLKVQKEIIGSNFFQFTQSKSIFEAICKTIAQVGFSKIEFLDSPNW